MCIYIYIYIYIHICLCWEEPATGDNLLRPRSRALRAHTKTMFHYVVYIYIYTYICMYSYIYIYILDDVSLCYSIHPVSITRFPSFRTQTLENITPPSMNKWVPEQPSPRRKSSKRESSYGDRVYDHAILYYTML